MFVCSVLKVLTLPLLLVDPEEPLEPPFFTAGRAEELPPPEEPPELPPLEPPDELVSFFLLVTNGADVYKRQALSLSRDNLRHITKFVTQPIQFFIHALSLIHI